MKRFDPLVLLVTTLLLSFLAAFLVLTVARETEVIVETPFPSHRLLFENYQVIKDFLNMPATRELTDQQDPELGFSSFHPFLAGIMTLEKVKASMADGNTEATGPMLMKLESTHPFIVAQKDKLYLKYLYFKRNYAEFIQRFPKKDGASLEQQLFLLNAYIKTKKNEQAFSLFKDLFRENRLKPLEEYLGRTTLTRFLSRLEYEDWFDKFMFLVDKNMVSEFTREKRYSKSAELVNLIHGEFAYNQKKYTQSKRYLARVKKAELLPYKNRLLVKMKLRDDQFDGLRDSLDQLRENPGVYISILVNSASLLLTKGENKLALEIFSRYIDTVKHLRVLSFQWFGREHPGLRNGDYWKALWICAWIHMQDNNQNEALKFFKEGVDSNIQSYRIANSYWLLQLTHDSSGGAEMEWDHYPFSFYYANTKGNSPPPRQSMDPLIKLLNQPRGPRFNDIITNTKTLLQYNFNDEAMDLIRWSIANDSLTVADKHTLMLIESVLWLKRKNYAMAFISFRDNFQCYRCLRLPHFLRAILVPVDFSSLVEEHSEENGLEPALVYSLIREESYFRPGAVSYADAYGLMQLLLKTARSVAYTEGRKVFKRDLFKPSVNIKYGTKYLKFLVDKYKGKIHLALAAYNAGDHRVDEWLTRFPNVPDDQFIEMIPFTATRSYVKNILRNYYYYKFYYGENNDDSN